MVFKSNAQMAVLGPFLELVPIVIFFRVTQKRPKERLIRVVSYTWDFPVMALTGSWKPPAAGAGAEVQRHGDRGPLAPPAGRHDERSGDEHPGSFQAEGGREGGREEKARACCEAQAHREQQ